MDNNAIFDEKYRVIAIDEQNLILRGIRSGEVLTIECGSGKPAHRKRLPPREAHRPERSIHRHEQLIDRSCVGRTLPSTALRAGLSDL